MSEKSSIPASWDPERNFLDSVRSSRHLPEQQRPDSPGLSMSEKSKLPTPRPASAEISPRWRFFESSRSLRLTTSSVQSRDDPINFKESSSLRRRVLGFFWSSRRPDPTIPTVSSTRRQRQGKTPFNRQKPRAEPEPDPGSGWAVTCLDRLG